MQAFNLKNQNNRSSRYILALSLVLSAAVSFAQPERMITCINENWQFTKDNPAGQAAKWQTVNLPHTWNIADVMDDVPGYYRGAAWYKKNLAIDRKLEGKQLFLFFEAANQVAEVFINGKKAGEHTGGYTAFYIPVTGLVNFDKENEILVKADNSHNPSIPPLSADFTFYGGIYRDVWLVALDPIHFSCNDYGNKGVLISTPSVDQRQATIHIKATITNAQTTAGKAKVITVIRDAKGSIVASDEYRVTLDASGDRVVESDLKVRRPRLWSPEEPYLYSVTTGVVDAATGKLLDAITSPLGFRWYSFDARKGFFLNGKPYKLVGTSRHQDFKDRGNALPDDLAKKDMILLKKMGGNFLRVAHYPQDITVLNVCDSIGLLASVEIPVVNEITESDTFYRNCMNMQVEMVRQYYNHPSVIMWCYMNEVLLRSHYNNEAEKQKKYYAAITRLARVLDSITRREDPYRYTMIAHHGDYKRYRDIGLVDIPMVVGWNLYSGWYGASFNDFPAFLDAFHKDYPDKPMVVSEYGADADPRVRSLAPVRFDKSVEYTTEFHRYYITEMLKRPFVAAAMIWNLADFNSETRTESMPHINNKGLLEWDRTPKDPYYYYQAVLSKTPFVKILGMQPAAGIVTGGAFCMRPVQAATNLSELELLINGKSAGTTKATNGICEWKVPFKNGINNIEIKGVQEGTVFSDHATKQFYLQPSRLDDSVVAFQQLNILLGANRYYTDEEQNVWIPDQEYYEGSWGHIGGKVFRIPNNNKLPYGTDKDISATYDDPVYQTQQVGIEKYRLDVPPGDYELTLHFAELMGGQVKELPYNLAGPNRVEENGKRIFDVYVNGKLLLENFDMAGQYGSATAIARKMQVQVPGNKGIEIYFKPIEGEPVLNALQVKKTGIEQLQVTGK